MKTRNRRLIHVATLSSLLIAAVFATSVTAAPGSFGGFWTSTDIDGSSQRLTIAGRPGGPYRVTLFDDGATVCSPTLEYSARGFGSFAVVGSGDTISGNFELTCFTLPPYFWGNADFSFTYDAANDVLLDSTGVTWFRAHH